MNLDEVTRVLTKAAAFDQRTIGEGDIMAWHEILGRYELADCIAAITEHYRESSARAMPADIRRLAIRIRDERQSYEHLLERRLAVEAGPTVRDRSVEVTQLVRTVAAALPQPDIHERARARARKERGRPERLRRRRPEKPSRAPDYPLPASDDIAALATRYLLDGYEPDTVADRLGVSRRWCRTTAQKFGRSRRSTEEDS